MTKSHCFLAYGVVLAFICICIGCEKPTEPVGLPANIDFIPRFIIENNGPTTKSINLKKAYHYDGGWHIGSEAGLEPDASVNVEVLPGKDGSLETWTFTRVDIDYATILSFVLTIDDKNYAGWAETTGAGGLEGIIEYGLGYVNVIPGEIIPGNPEAFLVSTLTPKLVENRLDRRVVTALYEVKITNEGVIFTLCKQSD
jgi:hypothetical protein